MAEDWTQQ